MGEEEKVGGGGGEAACYPVVGPVDTGSYSWSPEVAVIHMTEIKF